MLVSFIVPAYNVEKYIPKTLRSLLKQINKNFEIIVVNDGSTDKTLEVVNDILQKSKFKNFKIINKKNGGVSSARNVGLKEAKGDYVIFLDGDDYVHEKLVEKIEKIYDKFKPEIITWKYSLVNERGIKLKDGFNFTGLNKNMLYNGKDVLSKIIIEKTFWIWTGSGAYNREFIKQYNLRYFEGCTNAEDTEFIFKALSLANKVVFIDENLSYYVQRRSSITKSLNLRRFDNVAAFQRILDFLKQNNFNNNEIFNSLKIMSFERFIGTLNFFIKYYDYHEFVSKIEEYYPSLFSNIRTEVKTLKIPLEKFKLRLKRNLFILSPFIYFQIIKLLYTLRK